MVIHVLFRLNLLHSELFVTETVSSSVVSQSGGQLGGADELSEDADWRWQDSANVDPWKFWEALWTSRDLFALLAFRDFQIRYRQSVIGAAWAIIQPLTALLIFSLLFGLLGKRPADENVPYWLVVLSGLLPWQFFNFVVQQAVHSLVSNQHLITKARFPRQLLPLSSMFTASMDFCVSSLPLAIGLIWYGYIEPRLLLAPVFLLLILITTTALALGLSALNALYRDVSQVLSLAMQVLFYASAVVYQVHVLIPEPFRWFWSLNPLVSGIEGFRWTLLGTAAPPISSMIASTSIALVMLWGGSCYFRHVERMLADRI